MPSSSDPILIELGSRARARRKELGIKSDVLAEQLDIEPALLLRLERALTTKPRLDLEKRWEIALNVPPNWLRDVPPELVKQTEKPYLDLSECETLAAVIRRVSEALAWPHFKTRAPNSKVDDTQTRNSSMFAERYGVLGMESTLQSIGDRYDMTRERVRQITEKMLDRSQQFHFHVPLLDELFEAARPRLPSSVSRLDAALSSMLGESLSTLDADRFSREVLGKQLFNFTETPGEIGKKWEMTVYDPRQHEPLEVGAIRHCALAMIRSCGAANIYYVAGEASAATCKAISTEDAIKAVHLVNHFDWLLEEDGWFWFGPEQPSENRAITVCKKVLSVAKGPVDVEDLVTAMVRSRRPRTEKRDSRPALVEIPMKVLVALLNRIPAFKLVQYDDFVLVDFIDPKEILSESEYQVFQCLVRHGGVASKGTILKEALAATSLTDITFHLTLSTSPIISRLSRGIYTLRGREVDAHRFLQTQLLTQNTPGYLMKPLDPDASGWIEAELNVNPSSMNHGYFDIPIRFGLSLGESGKIYTLNGKNITLMVNENTNAHRLGGMVPLLKSMGLQAGNMIKLRALPEEGLMEVIPL